MVGKRRPKSFLLVARQVDQLALKLLGNYRWSFRFELLLLRSNRRLKPADAKPRAASPQHPIVSPTQTPLATTRCR